MRKTSILVPFTVIAALSGRPAIASTLLLNGAPAIQSSMGDPLTVSLSGAPGSPDFLLIDLLPGPTSLFGQSLPLGFSPFLTVLNLGVIPPSGMLVLPTVTPQVPSIDVLMVYLLGVVADPTAHLGLDFSNGASLTIVKAPSAGPPRATLVGHAVVLDSSGIATSIGELTGGVSVAWSIQQAPPGSTATLENPTQPYPTITPDQPGEYVVHAAITKDGGTYASNTVVHAFRVTLTGVGNGEILSGPSNFGILVEGSNQFSLTVDGQGAQSGVSGQFGPFVIGFLPGYKFSRHLIEIAHTDGSKVLTNATFFLGQAVSFATGAAKSLLSNLTQSGIDRANDVIAVALAQADLKGALIALPPIKLVDQPGPLGGTLLSAYADIQNVTFNAAINLGQTAKSTGLDTSVAISNLTVTVKVYGEISNIPYSVVGTAHSNPATFTGLCTLTPAGNSVNVAITAQAEVLSAFSLSLPGFPGISSQLTTISSALKPYLASQIKTFMAGKVISEVKAAFAKLASSFSFQPAGGVSLSSSSSFAAVTHTPGELGFQLNSTFSVPTPKQGAPILTKFLASTAIPPAIPGTGPLGAAYDFACATEEDFYNAALAAATTAGFLEGKVEDLLFGSGLTFNVTAGDLAATLPGVGFEQFDPNMVITANVHGTVASIVESTPNGPGTLRVHLVAVEMELVAETSYASLPLIRLSADSDIDVSLAVGTNGALLVTVLGASSSLQFLEVYSGFDPSQIDPIGAILLISKVETALRYAAENTLKNLRPPALTEIGLLMAGVASDFLGQAGEFWTQFSNFLP